MDCSNCLHQEVCFYLHRSAACDPGEFMAEHCKNFKGSMRNCYGCTRKPAEGECEKFECTAKELKTGIA